MDKPTRKYFYLYDVDSKAIAIIRERYGLASDDAVIREMLRIMSDPETKLTIKQGKTKR